MSADNSDFRENSASQVIYNGKYYRESEGTFYLNGVPVVDENLIKELQYNQQIANGELESVETNGVWDSYLLGSKDHPQGIKVNKNTKKVKEMTEQEAADLYEKVEKEKARKEREKAAQEENQRLSSEENENIDFSPDEEEMTFDDETGELITNKEKKQKEEQRKIEESPIEERPAEKDNAHKSEAELETKRAGSTQSFRQLINDVTYMDRIFDIIDSKWPDAPQDNDALEQFLRDKNVEVGSIGTDATSIEAWITTLRDCR
jgi:hypothetical protein